MEVSAHHHGSFCFPELSTPDMDAAKRFYAEVLGWRAFDVPSAGGTYALMQIDGKDVAGLHRSAQGTSAWLCYLAVESADRTADRARELGATVRAAPFDVPGIGRMALLQDPAGATVALWEARGHPGARLIDEPGAMCWYELVAHDVPAARAFYSALLGWTSVETRVPNGPYTTLRLGHRSVAGLMAIGPDWGPVTPRWQVYFVTEDCDSGIARTRAFGGSVVFGPQDVPGAGRFAILADPAGAVFAIIRPDAGAGRPDAAPDVEPCYRPFL